MSIVVFQSGISPNPEAESPDQFIRYPLPVEPFTPFGLQRHDPVDFFCDERRSNGGAVILVEQQFLDKLPQYRTKNLSC
jgi:hypothetical protein